jgi:hypothetical protein
MFHLDYLSCLLTVLATILLARKSWIGLLIAIANSLIVCAIGLRTSQLGFIPANLFCICIYAFSMRSWLKKKAHSNRDLAQRQDSSSVANGHRMSPAMQPRTAAGKRRFPSDLSKSIAIQTTKGGLIYLDPAQLHEYFAADLPVEPAGFMARSQVFNAANNFKAVTMHAWRSKLSRRVVATKDRAINPDLERRYAKRAGANHSI